MRAVEAIGGLCLFWCVISVVASATPPVRPGTGNPSPRLPRTSASQLSQLNNGTGIKGGPMKNVTTQRNGNLRTR